MVMIGISEERYKELERAAAMLELYRGTLKTNHKLIHLINDIEDMLQDKETTKEAILQYIMEVRYND